MFVPILGERGDRGLTLRRLRPHPKALMTSLPQADMGDPAAAVQLLRVSREVLANLTAPEAVRRMLEELAERFDGDDPGLASHLREQSARIGTGDEVHHAVRHGIPPVIRIRSMVIDRLRNEEDRRLAMMTPPGLARAALLILLGICLVVSLGLGAVVWAVLAVAGLEGLKSLLIGGAVALGTFAACYLTLRRALRAAPAAESERVG